MLAHLDRPAIRLPSNPKGNHLQHSILEVMEGATRFHNVPERNWLPQRSDDALNDQSI
jgi:hypothetical protein